MRRAYYEGSPIPHRGPDDTGPPLRFPPLASLGARRTGVGSPRTANVDLDAQPNLARGGIRVGTSGTAPELVVHAGKKTPLAIRVAARLGADPADFSMPAADVATAAAATPGRAHRA